MAKPSEDRMGFGLTLISVGIIWLLFKFNVLSFSVFSAISDLWPLLLVVAGVNLIFHNRKIVTFFTWMLFIMVLVWYGQFGGNTSDNFVTRVTGQEIEVRDESWESFDSANGDIKLDDNITLGTLKLDLGYGKVNIGASETSDFDYTIPEKVTSVYSRSTNKTTSIEFEQNEKLFFNWGEHDNVRYDFKMPKEVEWDINVNTGAIDAVIDLTDLDVKNLDVDCGAGDIDITYGKRSSLVYTEIDSGATNVALHIPKGVGIEVNMNGLIKENNFVSHGLLKINDSIYRSSEFEKEEIKIFVEIDTGVGDVTLYEY